MQSFLSLVIGCGVLHLFALIPVHSLTIQATNTLDDSIGNSSLCFPVHSDLCNLRSAWKACSEYEIQQMCTVVLPVNSIVTFNTSLGPLWLNSTLYISLVGENTTIVPYSPNDLSSNGFIFFDVRLFSGEAYVPSVTLQSIYFSSFNNTALDGSILHIHGDCILQVFNCSFRNIAGNNGGAVYVNANNEAITIESSSFTFCSAENGGAVYIDSNVSAAVVQSVDFSFCSALANGGALFVGSNNSNVQVLNTSFSDCTATNGAGMYSYESNKGTMLAHTSFQRCTAAAFGGGVMFDFRHAFTSIANCTFVACFGHHGGGGAVFNTSNVHSTVRDSSFTQCTSVLRAADGLFVGVGGGLLMRRENHRSAVLRCAFDECEATYGGGVAVQQENYGLDITGAIFHTCYALFAGELVHGIVAFFFYITFFVVP
jgi:hypothetical protein